MFLRLSRLLPNVRCTGGIERSGGDFSGYIHSVVLHGKNQRSSPGRLHDLEQSALNWFRDRTQWGEGRAQRERGMLKKVIQIQTARYQKDHFSTHPHFSRELRYNLLLFQKKSGLYWDIQDNNTISPLAPHSTTSTLRKIQSYYVTTVRQIGIWVPAWFEPMPSQIFLQYF